MKAEFAEIRTVSVDTLDESRISTGLNTHVFELNQIQNTIFHINCINNIISSNPLTNYSADFQISTFKMVSDSFTINSNIISNEIVQDFYKQVIKLNKEGRIQELIKTSYSTFDKILNKRNTELVDKILSNKNTDDLPISVLISFLNSTSKHKNNLKFRNNIYNKMKDTLINDLGEEAFEKSLYAKLK